MGLKLTEFTPDPKETKKFLADLDKFIEENKSIFREIKKRTVRPFAVASKKTKPFFSHLDFKGFKRFLKGFFLRISTHFGE